MGNAIEFSKFNPTDWRGFQRDGLLVFEAVVLEGGVEILACEGLAIAAEELDAVAAIDLTQVEVPHPLGL